MSLRPRPPAARKTRKRNGQALAALVLAPLLGLSVGVISAAPAATEPTLFVANGNPSCSNTGPGTAAQPFCTISAAASRAVPGNVVQVAAGTYNERVSPPASGTPSSPIVYTAAPGGTVTVGPGQVNGFLISGKSWITINGFNVTGTTGYGIDVTSASSNVTVSNGHVNYSGQPVSGKTKYGIRVNGSTDVTISGNIVDHNTDSGIAVVGSSARVRVLNNNSYANARGYTRAATGIRIYSSRDNTVAGNRSHHNEDSGIESYSGATNTLIYNNVSYNNGDHGIDNLSTTNQRIIANSVYKNVTAGINVEGDSTGAIVVNNISVDNGIKSPRTHGDIRIERGSTTGTLVDSNVVWLNANDTLYVWNSTNYTSLAAFRAASGQGAHDIWADPRWMDAFGGNFHLAAASPAIDSADSGVGGQPAADVEGMPRVDDPGTANTGLGPRSYDDRGAYEYAASNADAPPVAQLALNPTSGLTPLAVTADASASSDADATPIASYSFDFGDGTTIGPQGTASTTHTYTVAGTYTVTVTVRDTAGLASTASATLSVTDLPPTAALILTPTDGAAPLVMTADASSSTDGDATPIATYRFDFGDGTSVGPQLSSSAFHTYGTAGVFTVTVNVTDTAGNTASRSATVTVADLGPSARLTVNPMSGTAPLEVTADATGSTGADAIPIATYNFDFGDGSSSGAQPQAVAAHTYTAPGTYDVTVTLTDTAGKSATATRSVHVTSADLAPSASLSVAPSSGAVPLTVTADASASSDGGGTPIASFSFDFGDGSSNGPQAEPTTTHSYLAEGSYTMVVTVTNTAGKSSTAIAQVTVGSVKQNAVGNPGFETDLSGWNASASGTSLTRVSGGHSGTQAALLRNTSTSANSCTLNDSPNWVATTKGGPYTGSLWVRADVAGQTLKLRFREYNGGTLVNTATTQFTLTTTWSLITVTHTPGAGNTLDFNAYVSNALPGTCFYADDATITNG